MKPFACTPAEGKPDHGVALLDLRAVDQAGARDEADAGPGEVELLLAVDPRKLRRLSADERDTRGATDLRGALDQIGDRLEVDAVRGHVVEEEQRVRTAGDHVVDAVRGEVRSAQAKRAALPREDQLRPD